MTFRNSQNKTFKAENFREKGDMRVVSLSSFTEGEFNHAFYPHCEWFRYMGDSHIAFRRLF